MQQFYRDHPALALAIVLANVALSAWCLSLDPVINNDGVTYLNLAQMMIDGYWAKAFEAYSWPYYAVFIAAIAKISLLSIENSAFLLNTLFLTSLSFAFVCIVSELSSNNRRVIVIALLLVVFFPSITKYRSFVIRDFGYLSCYLWSIYFIFRFSNTLNKKYLIGWILFASFSCLFRFEGIAFLLIIPYFLALFTVGDIKNRRLTLILVSALLVIASIFLAMWYINDKYAGLIEVARASGANVHNAFDLFLLNTRQAVGSEELTAISYLGVVFSNLSNLGYELIRRMAVIYFCFAIYAYIKNMGLENSLTKRLWLVYLFANIGLLLAYSLYNNFLVSRYAMATALTLLLLCPFVIDRIVDGLSDAKLSQKTVIIFTLLLLILISIEGLDVRTSKNYIKESGIWIKQELPSSSRIYSNDPLIIYYAGRGSNKRLNGAYSTLQLEKHIHNMQVNDFDYVALAIKSSNTDQEQVRKMLIDVQGAPEKVITGHDERRVLIFKIRNAKN